jgi:hypothetical protein
MDVTCSSIGDHNKGGDKGGKDDGHGKGCLSRTERAINDLTFSYLGEHNKGGKDDGHNKG